MTDYGSAWDLEDPEEERRHRFTCSPFSPPEIRALADSRGAGAGYHPDFSSDTYSLVAILFWAVTGMHFNPGMPFRQDWRRRIREEYGHFGEELVNLLERGLSSAQGERFTTATELQEQLSALRRRFSPSGHLLDRIPRDELTAFLLLERYPLYRYVSRSGDLEVLCLGSGIFMTGMILTLLSTGQMTGSRLRLHILSWENPEAIRARLCQAAPALPAYSNLEGPRGEQELVTFSFRQVEDLLAEGMSRHIGSDFGFCRHVIISLGRNAGNVDLARSLGRELCASGAATEGRKTVIHYYMAEDAARNLRADVPQEGITSAVILAPFGDELSPHAGTLRTLSRRTAQLNGLYARLANPRVALEDTAKELAGAQRSSCAAAVHLRTKLWSIGLDPDSPGDLDSLVQGYEAALEDERHGRLLELEHRRWMMALVAEGWRLPGEAELEEYAFRGTGAGFTPSFHHPGGKTHHCLVPCSPSGMVLPRDHRSWDGYDSWEEIDRTSYDPLDRMSLRVHLLARRRVQDPATGEALLQDFRRGVGGPLERWSQHLESVARGETARVARQRILLVGDQYQALARALEDLTRTCLWHGEDEALQELEETFRREGLDTSGFGPVREQLEIYREFARYRDYKEADEGIIRNLLWILYGGEPMTLIKLAGSSLADNLTGPLLLDPARLIWFGLEGEQRLEHFLRNHGNRGSIRFVPCRETTAEGVYRALRALAASLPGPLVLDITGTGAPYAAATLRLSQETAHTAVVCCREDTGRLENLRGFPLAPACHLHTRLTAGEVCALFGGSPRDARQSLPFRLDHLAEPLWQFYLDSRHRWEEITAFFRSFGTGSPELELSCSSTGPERWESWSTLVFDFEWRGLNLGGCLKDLERQGVLRGVKTTPRGAQALLLSFQVAAGPGCEGNLPALKRFFRFRRSGYALEPFRCRRRDAGARCIFTLESGSFVEIRDDRGEWTHPDTGEMYSYAAMIPLLRRLEDMGLICDLEVSSPEAPVDLHFAYASTAGRECLVRSANILALYAWHAARHTGFFHDCQAGLSFRWEEGVENELDLVLTRGLTTLVVSCRTGRPGPEHLHEIRCLADRLSLHTIPIILFSWPQTGEAGLSPLARRAKAMGIFLLNVGEMDAEALGRALVEVASGAESP